MKKSILVLGAMAVSLLMGACASTDEIVNHFNNPPERYTTPAPGKEAEAAALEEKLQATPISDAKAIADILLERAKLLEGRCKRLNPGQYGAVATAAAISIDGVGIVMEDLAYRTGEMGKTYCNVYDKSEALKAASRKMSEEGLDAAAVVASMPEDQLRQISASGASIFSVLEPKQTVVTLQNCASEAVKTIKPIVELIPTMTKRVADLTADLTKLMTSMSIQEAMNSESVKAIKAEIACLKAEIEAAQILVDYASYIGKSCNYLIQAIHQTNAIVNAANDAIAATQNAVSNND